MSVFVRVCVCVCVCVFVCIFFYHATSWLDFPEGTIF
jgi:hypothetical protein